MNKSKNKKALDDKYCFRQAELGIGDCGGLKYIPGAVPSGKKKLPAWAMDFFGITDEDYDGAGIDTSKIDLPGAFGTSR